MAVVKTLRSTIVVFLALTLLTGVVYPLAVTAIAQTFFFRQANGSLISRADKTSGEHLINTRDWSAEGGEPTEIGARGSELIGQPFSSPRYFWGRPSATSPVPYNAAASTGSNLGPTNPAQFDAVRTRIAELRKDGGDKGSPIPIDLVTASASGLDPQISPAAADYQVPRVAKARGLGEYAIRRLIAENIEGRTFGVLGEPRVNVLRLNLALDGLQSDASSP
jgi:K+-transporting ATPase ATPase C chain